MKKNSVSKIAVLVAIVGVVFIGGFQFVKAVGANLVLNPGFETVAIDSTPEHWTAGGYGTNDRAITYETLPDLTKVGKVVITTYSDGDAKWVFDSVPVEAGALYRFSDRYASTATTYLFAEYTFSDASIHYEQIASVPSSLGVWTDGVQDFTPPAGTTSVTVFHMIASVGELSTDDYVLSQLRSASQNQFAQGIVSITFDDGWTNQYTTAAPILAAANMSAVYYIISNTVDPNEFGYMTTAQILDLQTNGNEIGGHTIHHCNLTLLPETAGCAFTPAPGATPFDEIVGSKNALESLGATITTFAYPNGGYNDAIKTIITGNGFSGARSIDAGFNTRYSDTTALKAQIIDTNVPLETIKGWVDTAASNKSWLILTFHQVADLATLQQNNDVGGITPEDFQTIVSYIAGVRDGSVNPILVKNIRDVLPMMATDVIGSVDPLDTLAPVITLQGSSTVSLMVGTPYVDAGATANDNVDGDITSSIVVTTTVNTAVVGTYSVTYNTIDAAGNHADEVTRTVVVTQNSIPSITLIGDAAPTVNVGTTYADAGATASDTEDGNITTSIIVSGSVDTATVGAYVLSYNVVDSNGGHAATVARTVTVTSPSSGGGGGGGGGYIPPAPVIVPIPTPNPTPSIVPVTGTVLGESCTALLTKNAAFHHSQNDKNEIKKLQTFLNKEMNTKLPVTGFYGRMTLTAVKNFQTKYKGDILTPVNLKKSNGNVFTLTRAKINTLHCVVK